VVVTTDGVAVVDAVLRPGRDGVASRVHETAPPRALTAITVRAATCRRLMVLTAGAGTVGADHLLRITAIRGRG